jgi:hypothetical protein
MSYARADLDLRARGLLNRRPPAALPSEERESAEAAAAAKPADEGHLVRV